MKLPYRSEIDGLRTIAVLGVILYHAQIVVFGHDFFKGGFVGVDIFFVISGYLISRILLNELFEKSKISFCQFYERRARRILPILFTVFIVSFPLAYKYLLPNQFIEYAQSILSATFFGSNVFFYFTNTQYGAEDSLLQPFLHTWSLGVEEQFYILFPIVLLLAYKFAKNHLVTIIAILILISLQYADWQSNKNTQLNFLMLTSRLWELGIGSLLAFYELKYGRMKHELLNQTMPLLGLAMIVYPIVFFNNQTPHPSFISLLPTLGTALIILYSVSTSDLVGKVLSYKPIVGIGLISYSMYLWHYPLFAFARIADTNGLHNDEKYLLILLTIVLSIISYFLIEKPFRNKQFLNRKQFIVAIFILLIAVLGMNWKVVTEAGYDQRFPKLFSEDINSYREHVWDKLKNDNNKICYGNINSFCEVGKNNNNVINIVGDSMMASIQYDLIERLKDKYKLISMTSGGCWFINNVQKYKDLENQAIDRKCDLEYQKKRFEKIKENPNSIIIIGGRLPLYLNGTRQDGTPWDKKLESIRGKLLSDEIINTLKQLLENGNKIILIYPSPESKFHVPKKLLSTINNTKLNFKKLNVSEINRFLYENRITIPYKFFLERSKESFDLLDSINHENIHRVYPHEIFCNKKFKGECITHDSNKIFYADMNHPTADAAKLINDLIIKKINQIEKKSIYSLNVHLK